MKKENNTNSRRTVIISRLLFIAYILSVIYFMFIAEGFGRNDTGAGYRYNVEPFAEIKRFYRVLKNGYNFKAFLNLIGNIAAFVPFGMFLPMIKSKKTGLINTVIISFLFSACIETIQLYFKLGVFDVDDIVLNTLGGFIGYLLYLIGKAWCKRSS
ncbi:MAG: VanZ family protein [Lachnospiraceae bacterium]|nr:VanZ family protein [Lachnospiraceae bacterium]